MRIRRIALLSLAAALTARAENQYWPELDIFWKIDSHVRLVLAGTATNDLEGTALDANGMAGFDFYIPRFRPILFRRISMIDDERMQRIAIRVAYQYGATRQPPIQIEHRPYTEVTFRWVLPGDLLASDRNRFEFRVRDGLASWRYRNQFKLERDFQVWRVPFTVYTGVEAYYDSIPNDWDRFRFTGGVTVPMGEHLSIEPYYTHQVTEHTSVRGIDAIGLTLSLYFGH